MRELRLSGGQTCLVDASDYEYLNQWKWQFNPRAGVRRSTSKNGVRYTLYLHRVLMNPPNGFEIDHINRDRLDNRRCNIRLATRQQNACNRGSKRGHTGLKGVEVLIGGRSYRARIKINHKTILLGTFKTPEEAHAAYCNAVKLYHGQFANTTWDGER